jgi:hypothetical protein
MIKHIIAMTLSLGTTGLFVALCSPTQVDALLMTMIALVYFKLELKD